MKVSSDDEIPNIWKNRKCSKPEITYESPYLFAQLHPILAGEIVRSELDYQTLSTGGGGKLNLSTLIQCHVYNLQL
jgi:hypothetical protein